MNLVPVILSHGETFGKLRVIGPTPNDKRGTKYRCGCECGKRIRVTARKLMRG